MWDEMNIANVIKAGRSEEMEFKKIEGVRSTGIDIQK
jgi:hypothetical protein